MNRYRYPGEIINPIRFCEKPPYNPRIIVPCPPNPYIQHTPCRPIISDRAVVRCVIGDNCEGECVNEPINECSDICRPPKARFVLETFSSGILYPLNLDKFCGYDFKDGEIVAVEAEDLTCLLRDIECRKECKVEYECESECVCEKKCKYKIDYISECKCEEKCKSECKCKEKCKSKCKCKTNCDSDSDCGCKTNYDCKCKEKCKSECKCKEKCKIDCKQECRPILIKECKEECKPVYTPIRTEICNTVCKPRCSANCVVRCDDKCDSIPVNLFRIMRTWCGVIHTIRRGLVTIETDKHGFKYFMITETYNKQIASRDPYFKLVYNQLLFGNIVIRYAIVNIMGQKDAEATMARLVGKVIEAVYVDYGNESKHRIGLPIVITEFEVVPEIDPIIAY